VHADHAAFRMTPQREAVLAAVHGSRVHPSAEEILREVRETSPGIGVATVYRTLDLLVRHGRIQELRVGDQPVTRYDGNVRRHDHVICVDCGRVFDVEVSLADAAVQAAGRDVDVDVDDYDLQLRGRCGECRRA
jgi:Fe2+ or Zn2+ uptake regulation protein